MTGCGLSPPLKLVNEAELKMVRKVGLDVNYRACSLQRSGERCHIVHFAHGDALEILYLGYEDVGIGSDCPIRFGELKSKDYEGFMESYMINPCWTKTEWPLRDAGKAIEFLRNEVPVIYHGLWEKLDSFLRKHELVIIKHL
jgi:hypothetical protein